MKGQYPGPMTIDQFFQALYQDRHAFYDKYAAGTRIKKATLYVTFCDGDNKTCEILDENGLVLDEYISSGAYQSAADLYEARDIEPAIKTTDPAVKTTAKTTQHSRKASSLPFKPH